MMNVVQGNRAALLDDRGQAVGYDRLIVDSFTSLLVCRLSNTLPICRPPGLVRALVGVSGPPADSLPWDNITPTGAYDLSPFSF